MATRTSSSASVGGRRKALRARERATSRAARRGSPTGRDGPNSRFSVSVRGWPGGAMIWRRTFSAMARYCSSWSGESELRYPWPATSSGSPSARDGGTPKRSCSVLAYSVLVRRRMTKGPGSLSLRYRSRGSHSANMRRSSSDGWGAALGGMSWAFTRASAFFQFSVNAACSGVLRAGVKLTPALVGRSLRWQGRQ